MKDNNDKWYSKASRCAVFGSRKNPCSSKPRFVRLHLCNKINFFQKIRVSARLLAKIRVSQGYCYVVQCISKPLNIKYIKMTA